MKTTKLRSVPLYSVAYGVIITAVSYLFAGVQALPIALCFILPLPVMFKALFTPQAEALTPAELYRTFAVSVPATVLLSDLVWVAFVSLKLSPSALIYVGVEDYVVLLLALALMSNAIIIPVMLSRRLTNVFSIIFCAFIATVEMALMFAWSYLNISVFIILSIAAAMFAIGCAVAISRYRYSKEVEN